MGTNIQTFLSLTRTVLGFGLPGALHGGLHAMSPLHNVFFASHIWFRHIACGAIRLSL